MAGVPGATRSGGPFSGLWRISFIARAGPNHRAPPQGMTSAMGMIEVHASGYLTPLHHIATDARRTRITTGVKSFAHAVLVSVPVAVPCDSGAPLFAASSRSLQRSCTSCAMSEALYVWPSPSGNHIPPLGGDTLNCGMMGSACAARMIQSCICATSSQRIRDPRLLHMAPTWGRSLVPAMSIRRAIAPASPDVSTYEIQSSAVRS